MRRDYVASTLIQRHVGTKCPLGMGLRQNTVAVLQNVYNSYRNTSNSKYYDRLISENSEDSEEQSAKDRYCLLLSCNHELDDTRKIICLRKSEITVERISVCNVTEKSMEHGMHCLPRSCTNDVIDSLP